MYGANERNNREDPINDILELQDANAEDIEYLEIPNIINEREEPQP